MMEIESRKERYANRWKCIEIISVSVQLQVRQKIRKRKNMLQSKAALKFKADETALKYCESDYVGNL